MDVLMLSVYDHARNVAVQREFFKTEKAAYNAAKEMAISYAMYDNDGAAQRGVPRKVSISGGDLNLRGDDDSKYNCYYRYTIKVRRFYASDSYYEHEEDVFKREGGNRLEQFKQLKNEIDNKLL